MTPLVTNVNYLLTALVILAQVLSVIILFCLIFKKNHPLVFKYSQYGLLLAFLVALTSTLGSLFYSEIAHFEPCKFCWFQRIFMYPQALLLGLALWKKNLSISFYSITLSVIGGVIALNHYLLQITGSSIFPCAAVGQSVSCSKRFVIEFGYITIPMMALSGFVLIILSMIAYKRVNTSR